MPTQYPHSLCLTLVGPTCTCWLGPINILENYQIVIRKKKNNNKGLELPTCIVKNEGKLTDKAKMLDCFTEHFIASGFLESESPVTVSEVHEALSFWSHLNLQALIN